MSTGTSDLTMAELARTAAERYGDAKAAMFLRDGEWAELSFNELWEQVRDLAFGLIGLGVDVGDRVCILANTRVEFTVADLAVSTLGAIVVPVYPSNSPDECAWVVGNSGAKVIVCEDASQVAKIDKVRSELPELAHVLIIDGAADGAVSMSEIAGRARAATTPSSSGVRRRSDPRTPASSSTRPARPAGPRVSYSPTRASPPPATRRSR